MATNTSPESWMNMQVKLDLWEAQSMKTKVTPFITGLIDAKSAEI